MAAIDFGVIIIKNGKYFAPREEMGCAYEGYIDERVSYLYKYCVNNFYLGDIMEDKHTWRLQGMEIKSISGKGGFDMPWNRYKYEKVLWVSKDRSEWASLHLSCETCMKMSTTVEINGVVMKIKNRDHGAFELTFKLDNDKYAVLMGSDIAFDYFWHKRTKKKVDKFLRKHLINEERK